MRHGVDVQDEEDQKDVVLFSWKYWVFVRNNRYGVTIRDLFNHFGRLQTKMRTKGFSTTNINNTVKSTSMYVLDDMTKHMKAF